MTVEEQHRFLHVAASREEFQTVYWYAIVALQTTARTNEMRHLRLGDLLLHDRIIQIGRRGAKNKYAVRAIPIVTEDAVWALKCLIDRARQLGSVGPSDFLFPIQEAPGYYDPQRPMTETGLRKRWDEVRKAAGLPTLRMYDLRHTGITRMAEAGVPMPVAMSFAGHITQKMQQHYIAISMASQRGWGNAVWAGSMQACAAPVQQVQPATATVEVKRRKSAVPVKKPGPPLGCTQVRNTPPERKPVTADYSMLTGYSGLSRLANYRAV